MSVISPQPPVTSPSPWLCHGLEKFWCLFTLCSLCLDHLALFYSCLSSPVNLCLSLKNQVKYLLFFDAFLPPAGRITGSLHCVPIVLWCPGAVILSTLFLGGVSPFWHTETPRAPFSSKLTPAPGDATDLTMFIPVSSSTRHRKHLVNVCWANKYLLPYI